MSKLPYYLEAALSFRSIKDLNKRYSKFINEITVGYECEISGGNLGDNDHDINEEDEIRNFDEDFDYDYQNYLTDYTASKDIQQVLEAFEITPVYGFFELFTGPRKLLISKLRKLHFRVMGLPMQNGDPIMEEPDLTDYAGYTREKKKKFVEEDTRLINVAFALKIAQENLETIRSIDSEYTFTHAEAYAIQKIVPAQIFIAAAIKNLQKPEASANEAFVKTQLYTIGEHINNYLKGWTEVFNILDSVNTHYFFVYDDNKHINILNVSKYNQSGLLSNLLEWSDDGKEHFEEDYQDDRNTAYQAQLSDHLTDARNNLNESESSVVDKIHTLVVDNVDESAELSQGYHQSDNFKGTVTVVEGDSSISPAGAEVVSPVFRGLPVSFEWLEKVFDMIDNNGMETNKSTGLHVNIGTFRSLALVKDPDLENPFFSMQHTIDVVKLAVLSGDHYLLEQFDRLGNTYARSLSSNIRELSSANFDFKAVAKSGIYDTLINLNRQFIRSQSDRYRTINMQNLLDKGYLEFRIAGGEDYHADKAKVKKAVYRYVQLCAIACDPQAYFKEYMTELYRLFVDNTNPADIQVGKTPRPKNVQEAMYIIRAWSSKYMEGGNGALPAAPKDRIRDAIAKGQSAFETDVLDMIAGIDTKLYSKVDANFLYAIRLLMLYSAKDKPNPRQYLKDNWNKYHNTSIKNYLAPKMYKNKPQWLRFFFTGSTVGVETNTGTLEASEEDYMSRINPGNKIVNNRPNFD